MTRAPSTKLRRGSFAALVAVVIATSSLLGGGSGTAVQAATEPAPASLLVAPATPVLDPDAAVYSFEALIKNPGSTSLPAGFVTLSLGSSALDASETGNILGSSASPVTDTEETAPDAPFATVSVAMTAAESTQVVQITVPRAELPEADGRSRGVYLLTANYFAEVSADDSGRSSTTAAALSAALPVVWEAPRSTKAVPLTLVVPFVLPASVTTLPNRDELQAAVPALLDLLDAAERNYATLAVDPRIIAATRSLGTSAPEQASQLLTRLETTTLPIFLLQFADADPAAQAALGYESLLQPEGFDFATPAGSETTEDAEQVADGAEYPANTGDPGEETDTEEEQSADQLLGLSNARPGAWPAEGQVDRNTVALLKRSELPSLVLDSSNVSAATGTRVSVAGVEALISDSTLASAARNSITAESAVERREGSARLAAELALLAGDSGAVLALDRGALANGADPLPLIEQLEALSWANSVSELQQPKGTAKLVAASPDESRLDALAEAAERSAEINLLAPLLAHPEYLSQYQRSRLLDAFATRYASPDANYTEAFATMAATDEQLLTGVQLITTQSTQLIGTSSEVPVTLRNALPFDASVSLHVTPQSAAISLPEHDFIAQVPATGSSNVLVPVHSRVSSGSSSLSIEVRDTHELEVFSTGVQALTLRTSFESMLLIGVSAAAALLFVVGVWRSIRHRRSKLDTTLSGGE